MKISKIQKLNSGKYKLHLSNGDKITTYDDVILKYNLLFDKEINSEMLNLLNKETNYFDNYNKAVKFISLRIRSEYELVNYLTKRNVSDNDIKKIVDRLKEINLLNDKAFVKAFVSDKIHLSQMGPYKIKSELLSHKIDEKIINNEIDSIDQSIIFDKLVKQMTKKIKSNQKYSNYVLKQKLMNYFINLGFSSEMINEVFENLKNDDSLSILNTEYNKLYKKLSKKYQDNELFYNIKNKLYQKGFTLEQINNLLDDKIKESNL